MAHAGQMPSNATLLAATTQVAGIANLKLNVIKLRWVMDDGWFPNGGFNLYRSAQGESPNVKVNTNPMKPANVNGDQMLPLATQQTVVGNQPQRFLNKTAGARVSSSQAFRAIGSTAHAAAAQPGASAAVVRRSVAPLIQSFNSQLVKQAPRKISNPTQAESIAAARSHLIMGAFMSDANAQAAGLGITDGHGANGAVDGGFSAGEKIIYTLKAINNGSETQVAQITVTVGADVPPPAPIVEAPVQISDAGMTLHMEVPPNVDEASFGVLYFQVTRTDASEPNGIQVGKGAIFPAYLATANGEVPALTTYFDSLDVFHFGPVSYSVKMVDGFGRSSAATTVSGNFANLVAPAAVPAAQGDGGINRTSQGANVVAVVHWIPSPDEGTQTAPLGTLTYMIMRTNDDGAAPNWSLVAKAVPIQRASPTELHLSDLTSLIPSFNAAFVASLPNPELNAAQIKQSEAQGMQSWTIAQVEARFPGTTSVINSVGAVDEYADTTVQPDHYYRYKVIPYFTKASVQGSGATSQDVGVPTPVKPSAPGALYAVDSDPPANLLSITGSATNVLHIQPTNGVWTVGGKAASEGSIAGGRSRFGKYGNVAKGVIGKLTRSVPDNYGRMETLSWSNVQYTSALTFDVYRANGSGFTAKTAVDLSRDQGLRASAEGAGGQRKTFGKLKELVGVGQFKAANIKLTYTVDTPPAASAYVKIGQTKPGEYKFVDLIPRTFANTYYYYVVPRNRWGLLGAATPPTRIKVKPSLPPSVPALLTVEATANQTVVATVQPNLQIEEATKYVLYRLSIPTPLSVSDSSGAQATVTGGKFTAGAPPKHATGTRVGGSVLGFPLVATGADTGGSIKYGIARKNSPMSAMAVYQGQVKNALLNHQPVPAAPALLQTLLALNTYQPVATVTVNPASTATVSLTDTTAQPGNTYAYYVVAVNSQNMNSDSSAILDAEVMHVFANTPMLASQPAYDATKRTISFSVQAAGAQMFVVERSLSGPPVIGPPPTQWTQIASIAANASGQAVVSDGMVRSGGQSYYYRVSAFDADGNSSAHTVNGSTVGYLMVTGKTT